MISIPNPIPKPAQFDAKCKTKGNAWLLANPGCERPKDFWSPFKPDLANASEGRCAFGAMWISSGTVDHFVAFKVDPALSYDWLNYRYVEGWINSSKKTITVIDPFIVQDDWFEVILPSLQLICTSAIPAAHAVLAQETIDNLPLKDDERILRVRREWYRMYLDREITLEGLEKKAPLIAKAIVKNSIKQNSKRAIAAEKAKKAAELKKKKTK